MQSYGEYIGWYNELSILNTTDIKWFGEKINHYKGSLENLKKLIPMFERQNFTVGNGTNEYFDLIIRKPLNAMERSIPISTVSKQYSLIQHHDLIEAFLSGLNIAGIDILRHDAELILSEYGERMLLSFTFPNYDFDPGDGNPIILKVNCLNSVDKSTALEIKLNWYRLVCKNGMVFGKGTSNFRKVHLSSLAPKDIADFLKIQIRDRSSEESLYRQWYNKAFSLDSSMDWTDKTLTRKWGQQLAARTLNILSTGYDGEVERINEKVDSHELNVKSTIEVPGQPAPARNIFHVSQALSWLAGNRINIQDRLEKTMQIPYLIDELIKNQNI